MIMSATIMWFGEKMIVSLFINGFYYIDFFNKSSCSQIADQYAMCYNGCCMLMDRIVEK